MSGDACLHTIKGTHVVPASSTYPFPEQMITYCVGCRKILWIESDEKPLNKEQGRLPPISVFA